MKEKMTGEGCVLTLIWFVLLLVLGMFFEGYVIKELWKWFVVPAFSAPTLDIRSAIGLALVASTFQSTQLTKSNDESAEWWVLMLRASFLVVGRWGYVYLLGYIVYTI